MSKRKIIKIEPVIRRKADFRSPRIVFGYKGNRQKENGERQEGDQIKPSSPKLGCCICVNQATKQVTFPVKEKGILKLEKYCQEHFDERVDEEKMEFRNIDNDNPEIRDKITVKESRNCNPPRKEDDYL